MKSALGYLRPVVVVGSAGLFVCLLQRTGASALLRNIQLLGWVVLATIVLSGARHVLRSAAWSYCIHSNGLRPPALQLLGPRLIGEALNDLTPAGLLVGEPAKVAAVSHLLSPQAAASSVILENLIYALGAVLFMLSGIVLALVRVVALHALWWIGAMLAICLLACIAMVHWTTSRRVLLFGTLIDFVSRCGWQPAFLERHADSIRGVEQTICDFFLRSRRVFLVVLAIEIATNVTGIGEAYLILKGATAHTSLLAAYLVESASRAVQFAFAFVPLGLGVQEGAAAATLQAVGYTASEGISLAVIRKIRSLFWVAVGLVLVSRYSWTLRPSETSAA
jgi:hypothetical protein